MKKIFVLIILICAFTACDKVEDAAPVPTEQTELIVPKAVVEAIKKEFEDATDLRVSVLEKNVLFQTEFKTRAEEYVAVVTHEGKINEVARKTDVLSAVRVMPESIKAYLDKNFLGAKVERFDVQIDGRNRGILGYKMIIMTKEGRRLHLTFDEKGAHTSTLEVLDSRSKPDSSKPDSSKTTIVYFKDSIPAFMRQFIRDQSSNQLPSQSPNFKLLKAAAALINGKAVNYFLTISDGISILEVMFDAMGNVLRNNRINITDISTAPNVSQKQLELTEIQGLMRRYLDTNYKGWVYIKGYKLVKEGKITNYVLTISLAIPNAERILYQIEFDGEEKFLGAKKIG